MPQGHNHSGVDQTRNRVVAAGSLGSQSDHPDCAVAGSQQRVDLRRCRVTQLGVVVRAAVRRAQPRALQVDTCDGALAGRLGEHPHARKQIGRRCRDQAGQRGGGAVHSVKPRGALNL
jgi:hypothetical protein